MKVEQKILQDVIFFIDPPVISLIFSVGVTGSCQGHVHYGDHDDRPDTWCP